MLIIMASGVVYSFLTSHYSLGFSGEAKIITPNQIIISLNSDELQKLETHPNSTLHLEANQTKQILNWKIDNDQIINSEHVITIVFDKPIEDAVVPTAHYRFILEDIVYWKLLLTSDV